MTNEELVKLYQDGDKQALATLIEANSGLVRNVAYKFYTEETASVDMDDLIQEGSIGLILAAQKYKFDLEKKAKFSTYAIYWIYSKINRFMKYRNTNEEISLNKPYGKDGLELGDTLISEEQEYCSIEESIYHQELNQELHQAIRDNLNLKQRQVICFRFGFGCKVCTLQEAGELMGVSKERVRQIEVVSLRRLRTCKWGRMKLLEYREEHSKMASKLTIEEENARRKEYVEKEYNWATKLVEKYGGIDGYTEHFKRKVSNIE